VPSRPDALSPGSFLLNRCGIHPCQYINRLPIFAGDALLKPPATSKCPKIRKMGVVEKLAEVSQLLTQFRAALIRA
jgi:hypothetical protein